MKNNIPREPTINEMKANVIMYIVQDMLDDLSSGTPIKLSKFEKRVLKILNDADFNWINLPEKESKAEQVKK